MGCRALGGRRLHVGFLLNSYMTPDEVKNVAEFYELGKALADETDKVTESRLGKARELITALESRVELLSKRIELLETLPRPNLKYGGVFKDGEQYEPS